MRLIKNIINNIYLKLYELNIKIIYLKNFKTRMVNSSFKIKKLNSTQKKEIKKYYSKYNSRMDYLAHQWYYTVTGEFNPWFIPTWYFKSKINPVLNNVKLAEAWVDKNYYELRFPDIKFPEVILRNISGYYYDTHYKKITRDEAVDLLEKEKEFVIKPSFGGGGMNIEYIKEISKVSDTLNKYKKDFVIQKKFIQHPTLESFNSSSVNIIRVISLLLDGEVHILSASLRVGSPGSFTDNYIDENGKGMLTIGINDTGILKDVAFFASGEKSFICLNGVKFKGVSIPAYNKMIEIIKKNHLKLPYFKMISWDMTTDVNGEPVVMEYNLRSQGIVYYQYANGPLFGKYTDRVLKMIENEKSSN